MKKGIKLTKLQSQGGTGGMLTWFLNLLSVYGPRYVIPHNTSGYIYIMVTPFETRTRSIQLLKPQEVYSTRLFSLLSAYGPRYVLCLSAKP